ncbi:hypothetical protein HDU76_013967 [Blyttiomyces sp. JEL0837]|nr:hypothetical protein HDU76_013967 [Blyttiomyces sp. JEL0837]
MTSPTEAKPQDIPNTTNPPIQPPTNTNLPLELLLLITSRLPPSSLHNVQTVSRTWCIAASANLYRSVVLATIDFSDDDIDAGVVTLGINRTGTTTDQPGWWLRDGENNINSTSAKFENGEGDVVWRWGSVSDFEGEVDTATGFNIPRLKAGPQTMKRACGLVQLLLKNLVSRWNSGSGSASGENMDMDIASSILQSQYQIQPLDMIKVFDFRIVNLAIQHFNKINEIDIDVSQQQYLSKFLSLHSTSSTTTTGPHFLAHVLLSNMSHVKTIHGFNHPLGMGPEKLIRSLKYTSSSSLSESLVKLVLPTVCLNGDDYDERDREISVKELELRIGNGEDVVALRKVPRNTLGRLVLVVSAAPVIVDNRDRNAMRRELYRNGEDNEASPISPTSSPTSPTSPTTLTDPPVSPTTLKLKKQQHQLSKSFTKSIHHHSESLKSLTIKFEPNHFHPSHQQSSLTPNISNNSLLHPFALTPNLTHLHLERCGNLDPTPLKHLVNLIDLKIHTCKGISDDTFLDTLKVLGGRLITLSLKDTMLSENSFIAFFNADVCQTPPPTTASTTSSPSPLLLTHLHLTNVLIPDSALTPSTLTPLSLRCAGTLQSLTISDTAFSVLGLCRALRTMSPYSNSNNSTSSSRNRNHLTKLTLSQPHFASHLVNDVLVSVVAATLISGPTVTTSYQTHSLYHDQKSLQVLDISGSEITDSGCVALAGAAIAAVASACVGDDDEKSGNTGYGNGLKVVKMRHCDRISKVGMNLVLDVPGLLEVDVCWCSGISREEVLEARERVKGRGVRVRWS